MHCLLCVASMYLYNYKYNYHCILMTIVQQVKHVSITNHVVSHKLSLRLEWASLFDTEKLLGKQVIVVTVLMVK